MQRKNTINSTTNFLDISQEKKDLLEAIVQRSNSWLIRRRQFFELKQDISVFEKDYIAKIHL